MSSVILDSLHSSLRIHVAGFADEAQAQAWAEHLDTGPGQHTPDLAGDEQQRLAESGAAYQFAVTVETTTPEQLPESAE